MGIPHLFNKTYIMVLIAFYIVLAVNLVTFLAYGLDKFKAKRESWRIPESTLFLLSFFCGSVGALLGMVVFNHKTSKKLFRYGVPVLYILQVVAIAYLIHTMD